MSGPHGYFKQVGTKGGIVTIDSAHEEIHEGEHFEVFNRSTASDTQTASLVVRTSTGDARAHCVFIAQARKGVELRLYEGSSNVSSGTTLTAYNNKRDSSNTANTVFISNATVGSAGTLIDNAQLGSSDKNPAQLGLGGDVTGRNEWILNAGTTYQLLANSLGDGNIITLKAHFYEED